MTPTNHNARRERFARFVHVEWRRYIENGGTPHRIDPAHAVGGPVRWDTIWALQHYRAERRATR